MKTYKLCSLQESFKIADFSLYSTIFSHYLDFRAEMQYSGKSCTHTFRKYSKHICYLL